MPMLNDTAEMAIILEKVHIVPPIKPADGAKDSFAYWIRINRNSVYPFPTNNSSYLEILSDNRQYSTHHRTIYHNENST